jgi:hypothetical protein
MRLGVLSIRNGVTKNLRVYQRPRILKGSDGRLHILQELFENIARVSSMGLEMRFTPPPR